MTNVPAEEPASDVSKGDLDPNAWKMLVAVLEGKGEGLYVKLLAQDGRFRARSGLKFTLYRCVETINGRKQPICVIVRIARAGHVTARRVIVGLDQEHKLVQFVDEPRTEAADTPKDIAFEQAVNTNPLHMQEMATLAVLNLADELVQSARYQSLVLPENQ